MTAAKNSTGSVDLQVAHRMIAEAGLADRRISILASSLFFDLTPKEVSFYFLDTSVNLFYFSFNLNESSKSSSWRAGHGQT
jgi:hypothetical protein